MGDVAPAPVRQNDAGTAGETGASQLGDAAVTAFNDLATARPEGTGGEGEPKRPEVADWEPVTDFGKYFDFEPARGGGGEPDLESKWSGEAEQQMANRHEAAESQIEGEQEARRKNKQSPV